MIPLLPIIDIINKFIPDKKEAKKLEASIQTAHLSTLEEAVKSDTKVRLAEMHSEGIASIWRPIAALVTFATIGLHWFIYPSLQIFIALFNLDIYLPQLESLPIEFFVLGGSFVTVYAYGRSKYDKRGL